MSGTVSRTIQLNVIGDASKANAAFKQTGEHAQSAGKVAGAAFDGVLGQLNSTGVLGPFGDALDAVGSKFDVLTEKGANFGAKLTAIGTGILGAGIGLKMMGDEGKAQQQSLKAAIEATGNSSAEYMEKFEKAAAAQSKFGFSSKDVLRALTTLTVGLQDPQKALDQLNGIVAMGARSGDLDDAAKVITAAYNGKTKGLRAYGVVVKDTKAQEEKYAQSQRSLVELEESLHEKRTRSTLDLMHIQDAQKKVAADKKDLDDAQAAQAGGQTFPDADAAVQETYRRNADQEKARMAGFRGELHKLHAEMENFGESRTAGVVASALMAIGGAAQIAGMYKMISATRELRTATLALAGAETAADVAAIPTIIALGLFAIVAAELALIGYEIVTHWDVIWPKIKQGAEATLHVIEGVAKGMYDALMWPANLLIKMVDVLLPKALDIPTLPTFGGGIGGGIAAAALGGGPAALLPSAASHAGDLVVHSHVHLDGKKVGEGVAKHTRGQLLRDQRGTVNTGLA